MDAYDEVRSSMPVEGIVIPQKLEADAFAVRYLGAPYVVDGLAALKDFIAQYIMDGIYDEETGSMALRELELRFDAVLGI